MTKAEVVAAAFMLAVSLVVSLSPWILLWVIDRMEARYVRQRRLARLAREQRQQQIADPEEEGSAE